MINFIRFKWLYFLISALVILPGVYCLIRFGVKLSVDFTGGTLFEFQFDGEQSLVSSEQLKEVFQKENIEVVSLQTAGERKFLVRTRPLDEEQRWKVKAGLQGSFPKVIVLREETVGPTLGKELLQKTIAAIFLAASFIVFYAAWRFKSLKYGICAILAMFHDTIILLGAFSLLGYFFNVEIDTLFVTAVLTTLSLSVHDTVVIYDRVREIIREKSKFSLSSSVNLALSETLVRSVNNSLTIIFVLLALLLLGGETIKWFVTALLIGTIAGTYSSTFIAAPLLVVWENLQGRFKHLPAGRQGLKTDKNRVRH